MTNLKLGNLNPTDVIKEIKKKLKNGLGEFLAELKVTVRNIIERIMTMDTGFLNSLMKPLSATFGLISKYLDDLKKSAGMIIG